jgi:hypothetical protein
VSTVGRRSASSGLKAFRSNGVEDSAVVQQKESRKLRVLRLRRAHTRFFGQPHQLGHRLYSEFFHHMSAMHLDCLFCDAEFRADLLVEQARDDELKDLELSRCQRIESRSQRLQLRA